MKVFTIANQKGGVGKTTTALNIADALRHSGYEVLFVDVDPQTNSTSSYKAEIEGVNTVYDLFEKNCTADEAIQHTEFGDIIAGDPEITTIETKLQSKPGGFNTLKKALQKMKAEYDYVIIDTPPNLGMYMLNALIAADKVIVPIKAEKYAIDGLSKLIETINDVKDEANPDLTVAGILLTTYDRRNELDRKLWDVLPEVGEQIGMPVFECPIRISQDVKKAQDQVVSLFDTFPNSNAAYDYARVTKEILESEDA